MASPTPVDDAKRREMMDTMDRNLDEFMNAMALSRQPTTSDEPFDFDKWCKKIDEHPLFMKELKTNEHGEYSEAVQALQALKYDGDDGNKPEELIEKADYERQRGNQFYGRKKYRWAIDAYTDGIRTYCPDIRRNAILHYNRAAAHRQIGNMRSALKDSMIAVKYDPLYLKAIMRCAECLEDLKHFHQCVEWLERHLPVLRQCDKIPPDALTPLDEMLIQVKKQAAEVDLADETRDQEDKRFVDEMIHLLREIHKRGICMTTMPQVNDDSESFHEWYESLKLNIPNLDEVPLVYYDASSEELVWPIIAQYPAVGGRLDLIRDCAESTPIGDLFAELLSSPSEWDYGHQYRAGNVNLYVEVASVVELWHVQPTDNLRKVLALPGVEVIRGVAVINLFTKEFAANHLVEVAPNRYKQAMLKYD